MLQQQLAHFVCLLLCFLSLTFSSGIHAQHAARLTLFEGARLILSNERADRELGIHCREWTDCATVGRKGEVRAPAGAAHVD